MDKSALKDFLDHKLSQYNQSSFIDNDPVQIPHMFKQQEDIEIAGFFAALFSWGQRKTILNKSHELLERMNMEPYTFVVNADQGALNAFKYFKHRTFNETDIHYIVLSLQHIYRGNKNLGQYFSNLFQQSNRNMAETLSVFKAEFFRHPHQKRTEKHIGDPLKGSTAKRLNMFLRWMVRKDESGVDFGLWRDILASELFLPLDVHSGRVARKLDLLRREQNDWKAVEEVTRNLRQFDANDPVKYDYALFGTGVVEKF
ncbi:MAG: TIGR02757 family protein [Bacteroidales bacterium]